ncbi:cellulose synthase BcsB [Plautia stali symbiont]|nr:cellulose synthase BcsB [Plautia stali symbiont]
MTMTRKLSWFTALLLGTASLAQAALPDAPPAATAAPLSDVNQPLDASAPLRDSQLLFTQVAPPPGSMTLRGTVPTSQIEFGVRSDEVVTRALLTLNYRP